MADPLPPLPDPPPASDPDASRPPAPAGAPSAGPPADAPPPPGNVRAHARLRALQGFDYLQKDLFPEAIACFSDALALLPADPVLLQVRGLARLRLLQKTKRQHRPEAEIAGELGLLLQDLVRSLELDPDRYQSYPAMRTALHWLLKVSPEARREDLKAWSAGLFAKAVARRARRVESLLERAKICFFELGEPSKAREEYGEFLRRQPNFEPRDNEETRMQCMMRENAWTKVYRAERLLRDLLAPPPSPPAPPAAPPVPAPAPSPEAVAPVAAPLPGTPPSSPPPVDEDTVLLFPPVRDLEESDPVPPNPPAP
ncbi:MAG: hypothetical protein HYZ53_21955 [Planctomycetes bacterium]|nr:hypothetical protein [Planctomycetota bacterium]